MQTIEIQRALEQQGFDPGPLDGAMGPLTRKAIATFEAKHSLKADGEPDGAFLKALFGDAATSAWLPWFAEAERRKGLHESRDKRELAAFLKSDGSSVGDPTKLPWCGDFVETCIAIALPDEPLPTDPYLAHNWLKFGVRCEPTLGCVLVFWRGSKSGTQGHVGFYAGEDGRETRAPSTFSAAIRETPSRSPASRRLGFSMPAGRRACRCRTADAT